MRYFIRLLLSDRPTDLAFWEEVPLAVFDNRKAAKNDSGTGPRYHPDQWFIVNSSGIISDLHLNGLKPETLFAITQALGVKPTPFPQTDPKGFVRDMPTHIKFTDSRRSWLLETATGNEYKLNKKAA